MLRMLIENGVVNINERDDKGSTPAHKGQCLINIILFKGYFSFGLLGMHVSQFTVSFSMEPDISGHFTTYPVT